MTKANQHGLMSLALVCVFSSACATGPSHDGVASQWGAQEIFAESTQGAPPVATSEHRAAGSNRTSGLVIIGPPVARSTPPYSELRRGAGAMGSGASRFPGRANSTAPNTQALLSSLAADYRGFRYDDVIRDAERLIRDRIASPSEKAAACVLAGAASYLLGNTPKAREYFRSAKALQASVALNTEMFSEGILRLFTECGEGGSTNSSP